VAGPTIASAEIEVTLDGDRIVIQARAIANQAGKAMEKEFDKSSGRIDRNFKGIFGRLKGSRNDFLNLVGVLGGGLERLFGRVAETVFVKTGDAIFALGGKLSGLGGSGGIFEQVGGKVQQFGALIGGLAGGPMGQLVIAAIGVAATLTALVPILGMVAAAIYGTAGAITALLGTVSAAALGAVLSLGPMLLAVAAGAGAAVLGIQGMTDEMKDGLQPIQDWYEAAKKVVAERLFANLTDQVESLTDLLNDDLNPLLENSADKLSEFADELLAAFQSEDMQAILDPLQTTLPEILDNLLGIIKNLSLAFSGVFAAISPVVQDVTDDIERVTGEFEKWVNSAEGQSAIKDFFDDAREAADALWGILKNVGDILGDFFEEGNDTGQKFLDKLEEITDQFAKWLDTPEGREELQEWFQTAEDLASKVYDVLTELQKAFDELNTPTNRRMFLSVLTAVENILKGLQAVANWVDETSLKFAAFFLQIQNFDMVAWAGDIIAGFRSGLETKWNELEEWWERTWDGFVQWFKDFFGISSPSTLMDGFGQDIMTGLLNGLKTAGAAVVAWFQALPGQLMAALGAGGSWLAAWFSQKWNEAATAVTLGVARARQWFAELPGRLLAAVRAGGNWLGNWFSEQWARARTAFETGAANARATFAALPGRLSAAVRTGGNWLASMFSEQWNRALTAVQLGFVSVQLWFAMLPSRIIAAVGNMSDVLIQAGRDLVNGLLVGMRQAGADAATEAQRLANTVSSAFRAALRIGSPSKVFAGFGQDIVDGLVLGLDRNENQAVGAMNSLSAALVPNVNGGAWSGNGGVVAGGAGSNRTVIVEAGAIQYVTPVSDPRLVAIQSLDELVMRIG
jgi:hypothetical protein